MLDYCRSFGIPTVVFRMSCIYGQRQMGTEDQGWVAHFLIRALESQPITIYGDGQQVRDILDVSTRSTPMSPHWHGSIAVRGRVFNLGGGPENAVSLLQLIDEIGHRRTRGRGLASRIGGRATSAGSSPILQRRASALSLQPAVGWRDGRRQACRMAGERARARASAAERRSWRAPRE